MTRLEKRLAALGEQIEGPEAELRKELFREFFKRLTPDERVWLREPGEEAESRVECPDVGLIECGCRGKERQDLGFARYPELREEHRRRLLALCERGEEIFEREPYQKTPEDLQRQYAPAGALVPESRDEREEL